MTKLCNTEETIYKSTSSTSVNDNDRISLEELAVVIGRYSCRSPKDGLNLMRSFLSIRNNSVRKAFVNLLSTLAIEENATPSSYSISRNNLNRGQ